MGTTKMQKQSRVPCRGFSAIELLITIGLMSAIAGMTIPMFRQYQINADLDMATEQLVQALRAAQTFSQTGKFDSVWGVYFPEGTLFAGNSYGQRSTDRDISFPLAPTIDTNGLDEVTFSRVDGLPSKVGSVFVTSSVTDRYRRIDIDRNGVMTVSGILVADAGSSGSIGGVSGGSTTGGTTTSGTTGGTTTSGTTGSTTTSGTTGGTTTSGTTGGTTTSGTTGGTDGGELPCDVRFALTGNSAIKTVGTNDVIMKVLGSEITYGPGGPKVNVRVSASLDGGIVWTDLFGAKAVKGNEQQTFENLPSDTPLVLRFNGRYSWLFNKTYRSDGKDGHVYFLKNGDAPPSYAPFDNQKSLQSFLKSVLDSHGRISIGPKDLLIIVELGSLGLSSADFQDAVMLVTFKDKPLTCTDGSKPRVNLQFFRLENTGNGNTAKNIYVGPQKLAFSQNQWIPLIDPVGNVIVDGGLVPDVKGIALERGNGWIRVLSHGSHANSSGKEIVDARVEFNHAYITAINNDVTDPTENPRDGVLNDTSTGDEFVDGPNAKSMFFNTRVVTDDDAVLLSWAEGQPSDAGSSLSSSTASSIASSTPTTIVTDVCSVPYSIDADGMLTLRGKADVTVKIVGSESTYGLRGPKVNVRSGISFDGGNTWKQLFGNKTLRGGELVVFRDTLSGSQIALSFNGRYSWVFDKTAVSGKGNTHIRMLRNGESFEGLSSILSHGEMRAYLRKLFDSNARIKLDNHDIAFLVELGDMDHPNYHDAVAILSIDKPQSQGTCVRTSSSSSTSSVSSSASSSSSRGNVDTDDDGIRDEEDLCPTATVIPESVPTEYLSFDRFALTGARGSAGSVPIYRTGPRKKTSSYSLADTRGCSCVQLLNAIKDKGDTRFPEYPVLLRSMKNLFAFYVSDARKFGCSASLLKLVKKG